MPILQVIVLALVQGLTEFLPVSSTAHLYLTSWLLGWTVEGLDFDIALHMGTLLAVLIYFLKDWVQIVAQAVGLKAGSDEELLHNRAMLWLIAVATVPVGIAGVLFNKQAETTWRNPFVIGTMLILVGLLMWRAEVSGRKRRELASVGLLDALAIGAAQALAVVPGTSRSGITISAALFRNFSRESAARFSFLLSTPAIGAAAAKSLYEMHKNGSLHGVLAPDFLLGVGISAITGCIVIAWLLHYLRRSGFMPFVYYRIVFGIIVIALALIRPPA